MSFDQHKSHKVLHRLDQRLTIIEDVAEALAWLITAIGSGGMLLTVYFSKLTWGLYRPWGWLRTTGLIAFAVILIIGVTTTVIIKSNRK